MTLRSIARHTGDVVGIRSASPRLKRPTGVRVVVAILCATSVILCTSCVSTPPDQGSQNSESRFLQEQQLKGMPKANDK